MRVGFFLVCTVAALVASVPGYVTGVEPARDAEEPSYDVRCEEQAASATLCTVGKDTYIGWRTYHSACNHCHAQDAVGSTFAPSLVSGAAKTADYGKFRERVNDGYRGQIGVMPAFKDNPNINTRIDSLYKYLKARSDGSLPPGRPARK